MSQHSFRDWLHNYKHIAFRKYLLLPVHRKLELMTEFENNGLTMIKTCYVKGKPEIKKFCREYLDYDYGTASNKQREYFKDEFRRYRFNRDFLDKPYAFSKWLADYCLLDYSTSKRMLDLKEFRYEFDWFCSMPWDYEPMHFDRWLSIYMSISPQRYKRLDIATRDKYRTFFILDYLHDCAWNREEAWIAQLGANVNGLVSDLYSEEDFNDMYNDPDYHGWGILTEELLKEGNIDAG